LLLWKIVLLIGRSMVVILCVKQSCFLQTRIFTHLRITRFLCFHEYILCFYDISLHIKFL
jgi:hypothetical protein